MKEIKFRAWDKREKRIGFVMTMSLDEKEGFMGGCIDLGNNTADQYLSEHVILMQYTGLKDKNGVEIYEGDVVIHASWVCEIKWMNNKSCFSLVDKFKTTDLLVFTSLQSERFMEVIGNIYNNPELLK